MIGADGGWNIASTCGTAHALQQLLHLSNCLVGDLRCAEARCFRFEQCPHAVDVAEAIQIEFGDANSAVALLHENATRQKFKHGLADGINGHFSLSAKAQPLRISHLRRSEFTFYKM